MKEKGKKDIMEISLLEKKTLAINQHGLERKNDTRVCYKRGNESGPYLEKSMPNYKS